MRSMKTRETTEHGGAGAHARPAGRRVVRVVAARKSRAAVLAKAALCGALFLLSGCDTVPIAEDVPQSQAREIVAVLNDNGVPAAASRKSGGGGKYEVRVSGRSYLRANSLLVEHKLPRKEELTSDDLIRGQGLLPQSRELEALKLDRALALQLEELIRANPSVKTATVVVRLNSAGSGGQPGVSVSAAEAEKGAVRREDLAELAARTIPGIKPEQVYVALHQDRAGGAGAPGPRGSNASGASVPFLFGITNIPEDDYAPLAFLFIGSLVVVALSGGLVGFWFGGLHQERPAAAEPPPRVPDRLARPARIEGKPKRDLTEV